MMRRLAKYILWITLFAGWGLFAQESPGEFIQVKHADHLVLDEKYPQLKLLSGNVLLTHKDAVLTSSKALLDVKSNFAEAIGDVMMKQGDSLEVHADVIRYDGNNEFGIAMGNVSMRDPKMSLRTDTLYYDLRSKIAYYDSGGTIQDSVNTLTSRTGKYLVREKRYEFTGNVFLKNPDYTIESVRLNYNTETGTTTFFGPTQIRGDKSFIYAEKGYYDTQNEKAWFTRNVYMRSGSSELKADSVYMDKNKEFYSATGHVQMKDSVNRLITLAGYAEQWKARDSVFLRDNPVIINYDKQKKDSLFLAANKIYIRGKKNQREFFASQNVRFFRKDFSGRADSLYRSELFRRIELLKNPVVWTNDTQITGSKMIIQYDSIGQNPDSLLIPSDVFIIQKDSSGFNQIKGNKLEGKFVNGKLKKIKLLGNAETIYYVRDEKNRLIGIDKSVCSSIEMELDDEGQVQTIKLIENPEGTTYPPDKIPEQALQLQGVQWQGDRRIRSSAELINPSDRSFNKPQMKPVKDEEKENNFKIPKNIFKGL